MTPRISVIIPTHNRRQRLAETLRALSRQTAPPDKFEVLVVADGCTDQTETLADQFSWMPGLQIISQAQSGPAAARNCGAETAQGELLIFLDDDIEVVPEWIEAHLRAHKDHPGRVVLGYLYTPAKKEETFFDIELRSWWERMFEDKRTPGHLFDYSDLLTGNFSISKQLFQETGGFNPGLTCHEDFEFGYRLIQNGADFVFCQAAWGYHHEETDLKRALRRKYDEGIADVQIGWLYPALIPRLLLYTLFFARSLGYLLLKMLVMGPFSQGKLAESFLGWGMAAAERMRWRYAWRSALNLLLGIHYWRGVKSILRNSQSLERFIRSRVNHPETRQCVEFDLLDGIPHAEARLNQNRPTHVVIRLAAEPIGLIKSQPGEEHLHGSHLRRRLLDYHQLACLKSLRRNGMLRFGLFEEAFIRDYQRERKMREPDLNEI